MSLAAQAGAVALGGALGSLTRWAVGLALKPQSAGFPWGTLAVNLAGSLLIGLALGWIASGKAPAAAHPLAVIGFLGGFTTFSSFSAECLGLFQKGHWLAALGYCLFSCVAGVLLAALGAWAASAWLPHAPAS